MKRLPIHRRLLLGALIAGTLLAPAYAQVINVSLRLATERGPGAEMGGIRVEQTR